MTICTNLHAHNGKDEHNNGQHKGEVAERAQRAPDDPNEQVERGPRFGQLEHTKLEDRENGPYVSNRQRVKVYIAA